MVFHEDRQEELFEFGCAEGLQIEKEDDTPEHFLQMLEFVATDE